MCGLILSLDAGQRQGDAAQSHPVLTRKLQVLFSVLSYWAELLGRSDVSSAFLSKMFRTYGLHPEGAHTPAVKKHLQYQGHTVPQTRKTVDSHPLTSLGRWFQEPHRYQNLGVVRSLAETLQHLQRTCTHPPVYGKPSLDCFSRPIQHNAMGTVQLHGAGDEGKRKYLHEFSTDAVFPECF